MGRRARTRAQAQTGVKPTRAASKAAAPRTGRTRLDPVRRTLLVYVASALLLAVVTLAGIVVLGGTLGPFITLAVVVAGAGLVHRTVTRRLAGATLRDEDRVMQTLGGGLLMLCVIFAASGAVVATLA